MSNLMVDAREVLIPGSVYDRSKSTIYTIDCQNQVQHNGIP